MKIAKESYVDTQLRTVLSAPSVPLDFRLIPSVPTRSIQFVVHELKISASFCFLDCYFCSAVID